MRDFWNLYPIPGVILDSHEIVEIEDAFISWVLGNAGKMQREDSAQLKAVESQKYIGVVTEVRLKAFVAWLESVCRDIASIKNQTVTFEQ
jgi:hypothetical protein